MAWVYLIAAGLTEVVWAVGLKHSDGFKKLGPSIFTVIVMLLSFVLLSQAMRRLPLGTSYAVWTGIGAVGTVIYGMWRLNEPRDWPRILCVVLIVGGIVGLKALTPTSAQ
jgi:quaternary ammonium compound-resistance protein SugE